jgi:hypothetical protein
LAERTYPANQSETALALFQRWFGAHFARSTSLGESRDDEGLLYGTLSVGRRWEVAVTVVNTLAPEAAMAYEAERAAIERRLDVEDRHIVVWAPPGAKLPAGEPGLSELVLSLNAANTLEDGRLELRRPVSLYLRRTSTTGSVVTILGGLSAHWAQFTNRVPGSFQMNALELFRLPASKEERAELAERIVLAAGQPDVDDTQMIRTEDVWTANELGDGPSCLMGSPALEGDEHSASLRRNLRQLLRSAAPAVREGKPAARALLVAGAATYADEEKLTWALRGMDPALYAGYDIIAVLADGVVKPLLEPARQTLPWDAPVG